MKPAQQKDSIYRRILRTVHHYLLFFLLTAFITSCCTMLFVTVLATSLELTLTEENLAAAAKLTFGNVILLSLLFAAIDGIRRKITLNRPVKKDHPGGGKDHAGRLHRADPPPPRGI